VRRPSCWRRCSSQEETRNASTNSFGRSPSRYSSQRVAPVRSRDLRELIHGFQECGLPFWCDGEVHGNHDRAAVGFGFKGELRVGLVDRWLRVKVIGLRSPPEQAGDDADQQHDSRCDQGRL
jgi:hypothetical protein